MNTTRVFDETLAIYNARKRIIGNKGGTRSSKTYSELQIIKLIAEFSKKQRIITTVSHSLPHLEGGAIRDFEDILNREGIIPETVRTKHPYIYRINKSIVEFVGFDRPGKALGAQRDILFINEGNKMPFSICHHLIQRTSECIFVDWNPSEEFWIQTEAINKRKDYTEIHSTFFDNIQNLTQGQLDDFREARKKANEEDRAGKRGYWWNWWQVYGLGLEGQLEGVIFNNWQEYDNLPQDVELYKLWVIDWGGNDPTTLLEVNVDGENNRIYIKEHIYQPQILNSKLIKYIQQVNPENNFVICDSSRKDKKFELEMAGIPTIGASKGEGSVIDGIERMQEFLIFVHKDSKNAIREFKNYKWVYDDISNKYLNEPEDKNNHVIDPVRYGIRFYRKSIRPN
jgi:phage terminase large subunit